MNTEILSLLCKVTGGMGGSGGYGGIKSEDLSFCLAGLSSGSDSLVRATILDDMDARRLLVVELVTAIADKVQTKNGKAYLKTLADLAIHEEIGSNCTSCNGTGFRHRTIRTVEEAEHTNLDGLLTVPCESVGCVNGKYKLSDLDRGMIIAEGIGEEYSYYKWRSWAWDLAQAYSQIADWQNEIEHHLSRKLA